MSASAIEPISFTLYSKDFARFAQELGASFERYGFAVLSEYDLPQDRIDAAISDMQAGCVWLEEQVATPLKFVILAAILCRLALDLFPRDRASRP